MKILSNKIFNYYNKHHTKYHYFCILYLYLKHELF